MNLLEIVDVKELQYMQNMFAAATGVAAVIVDTNGAFVTKPSNFTDFCMRYTRKSAIGGARCAACDAEGKGAYLCHAGLMDFLEPIIIDGVQYGNIYGGQVLPAQPDPDKFRVLAQEFNIPEDDYLAALQKVSVRTEESIRAAAEMFCSLVNAMINARYTTLKNQSQIAVLESEIDSMISRTKEISSKTKDLKEISTQQKILSINAAIEAGRAGAAGQGFKIVADQMGTLAASSTDIYETIMEDSNIIHTSAENLERAFKNNN